MQKVERSIIEVSLKIVEVSLKIIQSMRKASLNIRKSQRILPKNKSDVWALLARVMGSGCPAQGLSMPTWWATDARVTGTSRPTEGYFSEVSHVGKSHAKLLYKKFRSHVRTF